MSGWLTPSHQRLALSPVAGLLLLAVAVTAAVAPATTRPVLNCTRFEHPEASLEPGFLGPLLHVTAGNNRIAYRRFQLGGSPHATPLVLVMGYGGTMSSWGVTLLHRLAQRRPVVIFDSPAQGLSEEVQPTEGALTPDALEEGFLDFLAALNVSQPHVAGWSLGACAALKLAAHHPDRVSKVISWAGTSPDGRAVTGSVSTMRELFRPENTDEDYAVQNWDLRTEEGMRGACFWIADKGRMPRDEAKPEVNLRYSKGVVLALKPWNWASWRALKHCTVPVLLMGGQEDIVIPAHAQTQLAGRIPGAWLVQFPTAGHGFLWQHMDQAMAVMEAFLGEDGTAGTAGTGAAPSRAASSDRGGAAAVGGSGAAEGLGEARQEL